jgi:hypothetical protein
VADGQASHEALEADCRTEARNGMARTYQYTPFSQGAAGEANPV